MNKIYPEGWEFFSSLTDNSPRYVLPSRAAILDTHTTIAIFRDVGV
jgi:hypothetical protein